VIQYALKAFLEKRRNFGKMRDIYRRFAVAEGIFSRLSSIVRMGFVATALAVMTTSCGGAPDPRDSLVTYGKQIASSSEQNAIVFDAVIKTTETPRRAYQIKFKTNHKALMSEPNAENDQTAYLINQGKVRVWTVKFCTPELKTTMQVFGIDLVSGRLANMEGEIQSMAVCNKD
jgi:hypothetical protein